MKQKTRPWRAILHCRLTKRFQVVRLFLLLSIVFNYSVLANTVEPALQSRTIKGTVIDKAGAPLPGVNVVLKGTTVGTITDGSGNFSISVSGNEATLVFTFVGYMTEEVSVGDKLVVDITLVEDIKSLEEVVVVGYGVQKKESVVGSIAQVGAETLVKSGNSNITNALSGKLSGVLTMQQSGQPGSNDADIIIRGVSSWNGSEPLVLVDGVERDFKSLDPNEINTISVLKDASATAVFGAKGANGVVIVTSKRGAIGKPKLDFSASYGVQKATRIPDHISSYTTMKLLNVARMNGQQWGDLLPDNILEEYRNPSSRLNALRYPDTDWFGLLTRDFAPTINANFNLTGGTKFVKYFTSFGYLHEGGFFKGRKEGFYDMNFTYDRFNYRTNVDFALTKTSTLSLNVGGETGLRNGPNGSPWRNLYSTGPSRYPAYFPSWVLDEVPDPDYPDDKKPRLAANFGEYTGNPYTSLYSGQFNEDTNSKLFTDLIFNQKLDFILKGLSVNGKVALSTFYSNRSKTANWGFPEYILNYQDIGVPGKNPWFRNGQGNEVYKQLPLDINVSGLNNDPIYYSDLYYEGSINYTNTFGQHTVSALALLNRQQKNSGTDFAYYNEALVGRLNYDFSHKYLVEVNLGYTGSERFSPGNRFGFFPSAALGWVVSEENFFKNNVQWIDKLKFRYSDGLVGSDKAGNRWLYIGSYYTDGAGRLREDPVPNYTAQWEEAHKRDLGVELAMFQNKFTLNVDLFDEYREKMLLSPRSVTMMVGVPFKEQNLGKLKKHGIDIEAEYKNDVGNWHYFVKGIFGFNENRVIFKDDPPYAPEYSKEAGKPHGAQLSGVVVTGTGYYTTIDDIHNNPSPIEITKLYVGDYKFLDYNSDGKITSLDKYPIEGSAYPPITYSFSSGFTYKNFDFNFMFQGNAGKFVEFNQTYEVEYVKGDWRIHKSQLDYWTPTNPNANHSTLHYSGSSSADILFWGGGEADRGYDIMVEDRFWRNADYLRLKEVYASYTFKPKLLNRLMGVSQALVYVTGTNLWTYTKLIEGDPERRDFEQGFYPQMSSVKLGLKFNF